MIRVRRDASNRPRGFENRARGWRNELRAERNRDPLISAARFWRKLRPKLLLDARALAEVFHHKCAYCESRMAHVQHPHVEHYRPKSRNEFEQLLFDWNNWLLSCGRCNDSKWAHFPMCDDGTPCLLDPTADHVGEHLAFAREHVIGVTRRGKETVSLLGLERGPLEDERARWLLHVDALLLLAIPPSMLREARDLLVWCVQDEAPWAACTRAYLEDKAPKLLAAPRVSIAGDPQERIKALVEQRKGDIGRLR